MLIEIQIEYISELLIHRNFRSLLVTKKYLIHIFFNLQNKILQNIESKHVALLAKPQQTHNQTNIITLHFIVELLQSYSVSIYYNVQFYKPLNSIRFS